MSCEVFEAAPNPDGFVGSFAAEVMPDLVETTSRVTVYIPTNFTGVVSAYLIVVAGGTGNLRWSCSTDFGQVCVAESYDTHSDGVPEGTVAALVDELKCLDISGALGGLAADDILGVEFHRHGDDPLDTIGGNVYFLGVIITICS